MKRTVHIIQEKLNEAESGDEVVSIDIIYNIVEYVSKLLKDVDSDSGMAKPVTSKPSKPSDGHCLINHGTILTVREPAVPCLDKKISTESEKRRKFKSLKTLL